jgi:transcriptional regulator with XRE-family HTH domain
VTPGEYIRELRELRKLNKSQFAKKISVAWTTINNWELHGSIPDRDSVARIVEELHLSAQEKARLLALLNPSGAGFEPQSEARPRVEPRPQSEAADRDYLSMLLARCLVPDVHSIDDAHAVRKAMVEGVPALRSSANSERTARTWLDAARVLRSKNLPITAPAIAAVMLDALPIDKAAPPRATKAHESGERRAKL